MKQGQSLMLRLALGSCANLVALRKDQMQAMKMDYHRFRNRSAYLMFAMPAVILWAFRRSEAAGQQDDEEPTLTPVLLVAIQIFISWLLFFYIASALRESVLKLNGSNIRSWWIHHHYWSAILCCLLLSLPVDSPTFYHSMHGMLWWPMMQSIVMIAQNRYVNLSIDVYLGAYRRSMLQVDGTQC